MKRKIIFHGMLKKLVTTDLELAVNSVKEAIEAACVVTGRALHPTPGRGRIRVAVIGFNTQQDLCRTLRDDESEIHIMPALGGAGGGGGFFQIIMGVVLVAAAVALGPIGMGAGSLIGGTTALALGAMGAMMVLGGIMSMMSPAPPSGINDPNGSLYLGAPQNTTKAGTPIPIGYGKFRTYGQILSADIEAVAVKL